MVKMRIKSNKHKKKTAKYVQNKTNGHKLFKTYMCFEVLSFYQFKTFGGLEMEYPISVDDFRQ